MTEPSSRPQSFVLSGSPALLFVVTTAMATTVATAISTVLWSSRIETPVACACSCEQAPTASQGVSVDGFPIEGAVTTSGWRTVQAWVGVDGRLQPA